MPNEPMGPVIVGVDGSPESLAAVDLAAEEAVGRVTPLLVLHAAPPGEGARYELVDAAIARARGEHPGLSVAGDVVTGEPALALLARSGDACLAVVGHRGRCRANG
ncbi:MAG TPA: universal stress protein, partial [Micromonosporaceae bacterium]